MKNWHGTIETMVINEKAIHQPNADKYLTFITSQWKEEKNICEHFRIAYMLKNTKEKKKKSKVPISLFFQDRFINRNLF